MHTKRSILTLILLSGFCFVAHLKLKQLYILITATHHDDRLTDRLSPTTIDKNVRIVPKQDKQRIEKNVQVKNKQTEHASSKIEKKSNHNEKSRKKVKEKLAVCTGFGVGLGNLMFMFASGYGIAKDYNRRLVYNMRETKKITQYFNLSQWIGNVSSTCPGQNIKTPYAEWRDMTSLPDRNVFICCYLQSWRYFHKYYNEIKSIFTFSDDIKENAWGVLFNISAKAKLVKPEISLRKFRSLRTTFQIVSIHVRVHAYNTLPNENFIRTAMKHYKDKFKNVKFIVVSDSIETCRKSFFSKLDVQYSTCRDKACDLVLMMLSDVIVISKITTYSWWAGYLSNNEVVYDPHTKAHVQGGMILSDFYMPHWIPMTA